MTPLNHQLSTRRSFLKTSGAVALGGAISAPLILGTKSSAASPGDTIKVGLIGCGGRGTGAARDALMGDENVVITAMGDVFDDRSKLSLESLNKAGEVAQRLHLKPDNCFVGF